MEPIYLDSFATTPLDSRVGHALGSWLEGRRFGNPGSPHQIGEEAAEFVADARQRIAGLVGAASQSAVLITSGATESNNLALTVASQAERRHVVAGVTEHASVMEPLRSLASEGRIEVSWIPVDREGKVDLDEVRGAVRPDTSLLSFMAANNETGTIHPVREIGAMAAEKEILFHCDAAQAIGKVPIDVVEDNIDLLSLSGHKLYGPMGVGALLVSDRARPYLRPIFRGGGQEEGLRSGTVNLPGAIGLGIACDIAGEVMAEEATRLRCLRDELEAALLAVGGVRVNGSPDHRLPGALSVRIEEVQADALLAGCRGIAFSRGSACTTGSPAPSHVLTAMGLSPEEADETVRFGLGRFNTEEEIGLAVTELTSCIERVRGLVHA